MIRFSKDLKTLQKFTDVNFISPEKLVFSLLLVKALNPACSFQALLQNYLL